MTSDRTRQVCPSRNYSSRNLLHPTSSSSEGSGVLVYPIPDQHGHNKHVRLRTQCVFPPARSLPRTVSYHYNYPRHQVHLPCRVDSGNESHPIRLTRRHHDCHARRHSFYVCVVILLAACRRERRRNQITS